MKRISTLLFAILILLLSVVNRSSSTVIEQESFLIKQISTFSIQQDFIDVDVSNSPSFIEYVKFFLVYEIANIENYKLKVLLSDISANAP